MRWSIIRLIWLRELRDQLRDRRTLFMIAVLPLLLYPVLGYGVLQFAVGFREKPSVVGIVVPDGCRDFPFSPHTHSASSLAADPARLAFLGGASPNLTAAASVHQAGRRLLAYPSLLKNGEWNLPPTSPQNPESLALYLASQRVTVKFIAKVDEQALKDRQFDLILSAPSDFLGRLENSEIDDRERPVVHVHGLVEEDSGRNAWQRVVPLLDHWRKDLKRVRLSRNGLVQSFDEPFQIRLPVIGRASDPSSLFELLVRVFPFILVMWSLAGALYPAIDVCAGEKERGTMETLLITPAGREEIVLGKFLTIWVFSAATALLNLVSMGVSTWVFGNQLPTGMIPAGAIFWCAVLILPLSALFSAISLAIGAYARSSKEGQHYLMPLFLVTMPLIFLTLAPGVELNPFYSLVPVTGVALLMQKLMTASLSQVPWLYFIPVLAPIALYSALALRWAIEQFQREEVLFREAERLDFGLWLRSLFREKPATATVGQALFCFALIIGLRWLTMGLGGDLPLTVHTGISLLAFVAAPALFMALLLTTSPRYGLALKWPRWEEIGLACVLAILLLPPLGSLAAAIFSQFPHLTKLLQERQPLMQELLAFLQGTAPGSDLLGTHLLIYALLPALCEELAFRGFILSGLLKRFRPRTAILLCSFLFALFHMNVFQFLPAFFLGVVLGLLTVRSGSLVPAILFHALHNSVLIVATTSGRTVWLEYFSGVWPAFILICLAMALGLLWWLYRKPYVAVERYWARRAAEESALKK